MRVVVVTLLLCVAVRGLAQTSPAKTVQKPTPVQNAYLSKPLPLSVDTVGPNFKGHDIIAILSELKRSPSAMPKSEFETTQQFELRLQSAMASRNRQFVFVLDEFATQATYDADKGVMKISATAPPASILLDGNNHEVNQVEGGSTYFSSAIELRLIRRSTTQYAASNAFGVKAIVTRSTFDEFGIVLSKDDALFADTEIVGNRAAEVAIDMGVPTARAVKPFLRVALICTLVNPMVYEGTTGTSPTVTSPRETKTSLQYLLVRSDEVWVYDRRSGRILGKYVPGNDSPSKD